MSKKSKAAAFLEHEAQSAESEAELKAQVRALERRLRGLQTREAAIVEAVRDTIGAAAFAIRPPPMPAFRKRPYEEIAILHLSDTQCGKITRSYDTQVCGERVLQCVEKTAYIASLRRQIATINELHLYLGGDMIEGEDIFPHQAHEIDSSVFEQAVLNFPRIAVKAIMSALVHFPRVKVYCVTGNHGRNGPKSTRSSPKTNWDGVAYETTRALLLGSAEYPRKDLAKRLTFQIADEFWIVDRVFDWGNLMVHGHQIGGGFAGFPWYGSGKAAWGWIDAIEEKWDNLFFGHFHTAASATLGLRRFYANGTTESDNTFAKEQMKSCGSPCQRLIFMDAKHGVVSDSLIQLAKVVPSARR
jgi:hypothetical protein